MRTFSEDCRTIILEGLGTNLVTDLKESSHVTQCSLKVILSMWWVAVGHRMSPWTHPSHRSPDSHHYRTRGRLSVLNIKKFWVPPKAVALILGHKVVRREQGFLKTFHLRFFQYNIFLLYYFPSPHSSQILTTSLLSSFKFCLLPSLNKTKPQIKTDQIHYTNKAKPYPQNLFCFVLVNSSWCLPWSVANSPKET